MTQSADGGPPAEAKADVQPIFAAHLWVRRLPDTLDRNDRDLLDEAERVRMDRYVHSRDSAYFGGARAEAKRIVAQEVGVPAREVRFGCRPCPRCGRFDHGPPMVRDPACPVHVGWSRSRDVVAVVVGRNGPLGVDIESDDRVLDVELLARNTLSPDEAAVFASCRTDAGRREVFLRCWTRKEAVLKAAGIGIATELPSVEVQPGRCGPVRVVVPEMAGVWTVSDLRVPAPAGDRDRQRCCLVVAVAQLVVDDRTDPGVVVRRWFDAEPPGAASTSPTGTDATPAAG